jgi:hypothetical protein
VPWGGVSDKRTDCKPAPSCWTAGPLAAGGAAWTDVTVAVGADAEAAAPGVYAALGMAAAGVAVAGAGWTEVSVTLGAAAGAAPIGGPAAGAGAIAGAGAMTGAAGAGAGA